MSRVFECCQEVERYADSILTQAEIFAPRLVTDDEFGEELRRERAFQRREFLLSRARLVFCTSSVAGRSLLKNFSSRRVFDPPPRKGARNPPRFESAIDAVIVDEAAQLLEAEALIPIALGTSHLLLRVALSESYY
jgi:hypothetical protein